MISWYDINEYRKYALIWARLETRSGSSSTNCDHATPSCRQRV